MKQITAVFVFCAALLLAVNGYEQIDFRPLRTSPAFIWGNSNYLFSGQNIQVLDLVSSDDIKNSLLRNKINTVLSPHFVGANSQQPEVMFIFVEEQLRSDQVPLLGESLNNVKTLVKSSPASMSIPYLYNSNGNLIGNQIALAVAQNANKVVVATNRDSVAIPSSLAGKTISLEKLMSLSSDNSWELLNNNQMDVVVVYFDNHSANNNKPMTDAKMVEDIAADDAFIGKLLSNVNSRGASYIALFTAQQPSTQFDYFMPSSDPKLARFEEALSQEQLGATDDGWCDDCLWPNAVQEGLIVIAPFLIILIIGVTCNFQIQSELKYDAERPKKW